MSRYGSWLVICFGTKAGQPGVRREDGGANNIPAFFAAYLLDAAYDIPHGP